MPTIFLSPSTQEYNQYVTGAGSEEYFMNLLADAMEPLCSQQRGIQLHPQRSPEHDRRPTPSGRANARAATTFIWPSTPTPPARAARAGAGASSPFTIPAAPNGQRAAELFVSNPARDLPPAESGDDPLHHQLLQRCDAPRFPAVLLEIGYHDNAADAQWIAGAHRSSSPRPWYRP